MQFQGTQRILILILNERKACKKSKKTVFVYFDGSFSDIFFANIYIDRDDSSSYRINQFFLEFNTNFFCLLWIFVLFSVKFIYLSFCNESSVQCSPPTHSIS